MEKSNNETVKKKLQSLWAHCVRTSPVLKTIEFKGFHGTLSWK